MVTEEEMNRIVFDESSSVRNASIHLSPEEKQEQDAQLKALVLERKHRLESERCIKPTPAFGLIEELCDISETSLKKSLLGQQKITRTFIYKFSVGMNMTLEEANRLFSLCGGPLDPSVKEDYICIRAIEDHDDIHTFISQFKEFTGFRLSRISK